MPLPKLQLLPAREGYSFADDSGAVIRAKVSAGPSFQRLDMIGGPAEVNVTFRMTGAEYDYWRAFHRSTIAVGSEPFLLDLILDQSTLTEHQVKIIPGSLRMGGVSGDRHVVEMRLEAQLADSDPDYDAALVMMFELYGADGSDVLDLLAVLVNDLLP